MASDQEDKPVTIECSPNGPLLVKNLKTLRNSKGEPLLLKPVVALCRCGASERKPFCDGTHTKNGFKDAKLTDGAWDKRESYAGASITVHDNRGICSHASVCADELEAVFNADREPWVDPDAAPVEAIIEIIKKCPSGALSYSIEGTEFRDQDRKPAITVSKNGPYFVVGGIELQNVKKGDCASDEHFALCRCGGSKNLPFCDGAHRDNGFRDEKN